MPNIPFIDAISPELRKLFERHEIAEAGALAAQEKLDGIVGALPEHLGTGTLSPLRRVLKIREECLSWAERELEKARENQAPKECLHRLEADVRFLTGQVEIVETGLKNADAERAAILKEAGHDECFEAVNDADMRVGKIEDRIRAFRSLSVADLSAKMRFFRGNFVDDFDSAAWDYEEFLYDGLEQDVAQLASDGTLPIPSVGPSAPADPSGPSRLWAAVVGFFTGEPRKEPGDRDDEDRKVA